MNVCHGMLPSGEVGKVLPASTQAAVDARTFTVQCSTMIGNRQAQGISAKPGVAESWFGLPLCDFGHDSDTWSTTA